MAAAFAAACYSAFAVSFPGRDAVWLCALTTMAVALGIFVWVVRTRAAGGAEADLECRCRYETLRIWFGYYGPLAALGVTLGWAFMPLPLPAWIRRDFSLLGTLILSPWLLMQSQRVAAGFDPYDRGDFRSWDFLVLRYKRMGPLAREQTGEDLRRIFSKAVDLRPGLKIAELGAGGSVVWDHLPPADRKGWILVDADPAAIYWGRTRGVGERWLCADARRLPFEEGELDGIVGMSFFDSIHDEQLDDILAEARRVLRPGGFLLHLQNLREWPAPDLCRALDPLLAEAGVPGSVRFRLLSSNLRFPAFDSEIAPAAFRRLSETATGIRRDRLEFLAEIGGLRGPVPLELDPRRVFQNLLAAALRRHGFEVHPAAPALKGALRRTVYLAASAPSGTKTS
jgi:SAM-dependent methyltransferase